MRGIHVQDCPPFLLQKYPSNSSSLLRKSGGICVWPKREGQWDKRGLFWRKEISVETI